ncbi:hypothetical protein LX15_004360 [Streptoalloteichus tenebrarius]|uniref:Cholesterol esterase n=1 Tax=Streptoalloteichus tenebrarius (strain ATCC 17920 / DSM 40477 / JCM 4838 / CBS 697.72 / NBRC 16177 / NCIMB 11028 / NRRL B-12390 / A12253. 1 / ISP 5477) TaxID=1933 RepID=A0ABT1HYR9_STRSD|nr:DUF6230 family protein [Streptoalloteichus tenebrarius]MCP2260641.1 hypothetical protein [Streptoalloteichus tenebrarius]BFF01525.1 DUF6230 family protein [Streptoalloteichus tenebrarius]
MVESGARGRTRWGRFAMVVAAGGVGVGVLMFGMSSGALAASFTVAGTSFKASADGLTGTGFVQYGSVDRSSDKAHPVAVNGMRTATLDNFCQSMVVPGLPGVGDITVKITAGGKGGMSAENLVINMEQLDADLTLGNAEIGVDAAQLGKGPQGATGAAGTLGIQADTVQLGALRQTAWSTTASTLRFKGMKLDVFSGRNECF